MDSYMHLGMDMIWVFRFHSFFKKSPAVTTKFLLVFFAERVVFLLSLLPLTRLNVLEPSVASSCAVHPVITLSILLFAPFSIFFTLLGSIDPGL